MNLLRIWFLVMLAVVLPVRGALAAAMLCAPTGMGGHGGVIVAEPAMEQDHGAVAPHHADHDHHPPVAHDHGGHAGDQAGHDKCNTCSASCSSPTLPSDWPGIPEPLPVTSAWLPGLSAPAPTFMSGGQDRPPRTS